MNHYIVHQIYGATPGVVHYEAETLPDGIVALSGPCASPEEAWTIYWTSVHPREQFLEQEQFLQQLETEDQEEQMQEQEEEEQQQEEP